MKHQGLMAMKLMRNLMLMILFLYWYDNPSAVARTSASVARMNKPARLFTYLSIHSQRLYEYCSNMIP